MFELDAGTTSKKRCVWDNARRAERRFTKEVKINQSAPADAQPSEWIMQLLASELGAHPFLQGMKPEHLELLANVSMRSEFATGERIFREGESANRFYLIVSGRVVIESVPREGTPITIQELYPGDVLGWSWMFPPYYWHFDARAAEATRAIFLYGSPLRDQCEENPSLGYELMKRFAATIITRLQATRRQLLEAKGRTW